MAGDWIKMRVDIGDDPAVIQIACQLDISEDEVVGKLHRLWSWADKHTTDGTAPAITPRWVDRYVSLTGFADAMAEALWISFSDQGVVFPEFDRHNGESAKRRVEATLRQRLSRENRDKGEAGEQRTPIPKPFVRFVLNRDGHQCVYCGTQSSPEKEASKKAILSVDHIKPITRGGSAAVENLACACRDCNQEKSDRTPEEWGVLPTQLQPGLLYENQSLITNMSRNSCDKDVTREEKRREEIKKELKSKAETATATRLPAEWQPTLEDIAFCKTSRPELRIDEVQERFRDHWISTGGGKGRKLDWSATWRNWVRNERGPPSRSPVARPEKFDPTAYVNRNRKIPDERTIDIDATGEPIL